MYIVVYIVECTRTLSKIYDQFHYFWFYYNSSKDKMSVQRNFTPTFYGLSVKITKNGLVTFIDVLYLASFLGKFCFKQYANIILDITVHQCIVFSLKKCRTKLRTLYVSLQVPICCILVQLLEIYHGYCKRKPYSTKNHYAL